MTPVEQKRAGNPPTRPTIFLVVLSFIRKYLRSMVPPPHRQQTRTRSFSSAGSDAAAAETPKRGTVGRTNSPRYYDEDSYRQQHANNTSRFTGVQTISASARPQQSHSSPIVHYRETRYNSLPMAVPFFPPKTASQSSHRYSSKSPTTSTPVITPTASDASHPSNTSTIKTQKKYTRSYDWTDDSIDERILRPPSPESTVLTGPSPYQPPPIIPSEDYPPDDSSIVDDDTTSAIGLRNNDTVHVRVGISTTVTHARHKLRRSSPYLRKLLSDESTEVLQLENSNARDWHTLMDQYVLAGRYRKYSANDWGRPSSTVLPDFLPWFVLLELDDCLKTADTALGIVNNSLPDVQSHNDAMDRLKICAIAKTANLRRTMEEGFASTARQFMDHRGCFLTKGSRETSLLWTIAKLLVGCLSSNHEVDDEDDNDEETSGCNGERTADEILEAIQHSDLFLPKSASLLCRAVFEYIPEECLMDHLWAANRSQLLRLLQNPLFPHLLRAGIIDDESSSSPEIPKTFSFMLWDDAPIKRKRPSEWLERIWNHLQKPPKLVAIPAQTALKRDQNRPRRFQC